ncbi:MAG: hypothetical protein K9J16_10620 [Melioribacteraceae bacterium]|nr:hypothetical protein [Melioribacteraceae bacterium]MCF8354493.1 hypothetical protein [Melioribacteraceae bacterium]MCF8394103.1 hypothetical protein [Melioribacteraceae bacterium]MCF8419845.1 hypothetical protein [Melioribacteraceae bacterium]
MSLYTIVFILVTILLMLGLTVVAWLIMKMDKYFDRRDRLGRESIYKLRDELREREKKKKETSENENS